MKKVLLASFLFLGAMSVKAQDEVGQNVVKVNPLGLLFGSANIGYERALNSKSSFVIAPQFGGFKFGGMKYSSFGAGAQYRLYLSKSKSAPEGFYGAPGLSFVSGKVKWDFDGEKEESKFSSFGGGVMVGHQWIYNSGFVLDLGGGFNYQKFNYKDDADNSGISFKGGGILPALSFSIGYNF